MILKYVCESFSGAIRVGRFNSNTSKFVEKAAVPEKCGIVIPVNNRYYHAKLKNDERYPKFFQGSHVGIGPHDLLYRL